MCSFTSVSLSRKQLGHCITRIQEVILSTHQFIPFIIVVFKSYVLDYLLMYNLTRMLNAALSKVKISKAKAAQRYSSKNIEKDPVMYGTV